MKVSNAQLVDSVNSLNTLNELTLPVRTAFKLAKISRKIETVLADYNKTLAKLQQKHVQKDEAGQPDTYTAEDGTKRLLFEDPQAFQKEYAELLALETEIELDKLTLDELGSVEVKPTVLYSIDWLIEA